MIAKDHSRNMLIPVHVVGIWASTAQNLVNEEPWPYLSVSRRSKTASLVS